MSRWESRIVPASARRAGRTAGVVVPVMVSWACAVMLVPAFPRCNSSLRCPAWSHTHGM